MARYFALSLLLLLAPVGSAQTVADFFNSSTLQEIRFTMDPDDLSSMLRNYQDASYHHASFTWNGVRLDNIGVKIKGSTSRRATKPSLKIDVTKYESLSFLGLKGFTLNNNVQDYTMMKERLTMQVFERMGIPAPRETSCKVFINDQYFGLYTLLETTDKNALLHWYGEDAGYLYEVQLVEGYRFQYLGSNPELYSPSLFKPETHEKDPDPVPLEAMVRAVNLSSDAAFEAAVGQYLDLRKFLTHVAVEAYLAEYDGLLGEAGMNNAYFYRFDGRTLGQFIPKDKDNTFTGPDYPALRQLEANVLTRRALAIPSLRKHFTSELFRVAAIAGGQDGWLWGEINRIYAQIRDAVRADTGKECQDGVCSLADSNDTFERFIVYIRDITRLRRSYIEQELTAAGYPVGNQLPPVIVQGAVANAATNRAGPLAPGVIASLYGERLSATVATASAAGWPGAAAGCRVLVNGVAAPLAYVSPGQVNFQIPWETATAGPATIVVETYGGSSAAITVPIALQSPGLFAVADALTGGLVDAAHPALPDASLSLYATGLGAVSPQPASGLPAPLDSLARTVGDVSVTIAGVPAFVDFSGLAPGFVGLYQVNIRMPRGVAPGRQSVILRSGGSQSPEFLIPTQ